MEWQLNHIIVDKFNIVVYILYNILGMKVYYIHRFTSKNISGVFFFFFIMIMYGSKYFWQGEKIRLRGVSANDWEEWLDDFEDSDAIRLLNWGIPLPKSEEVAKAIFSQWANFKDTSNRIMFSIETLNGELVGGINIH